MKHTAPTCFESILGICVLGLGFVHGTIAGQYHSSAGLKVDPRYLPTRVAAPTGSINNDGQQFALIQPVNIIVNFNPGNPPNTAPWPTAARAAFIHAAAIWDLLLDNTQPIVIDAFWRTDVAPDTLGSAGPVDNYRNFANAPQAGTRYAVALANQLAGRDLNGASAEITARFNSNFTWYFGLDGETPEGQHDFVTVVLHEICHGLGFVDSFARVATGNGSWGDGTGFPTVYDGFIENGGGQGLVGAFANPSPELGNQLISNNLLFDSPLARTANGGNRPQIYAPNPWDAGSSIAHLNDATFDGTSHALMTHALGNGESAHHPGTITLGILRDLGWPMVARFDQVFVDRANNGMEDGTVANPFNTIEEGAAFVADAGTVRISPGSYPENCVISRRITMEKNGTSGAVTIGN